MVLPLVLGAIAISAGAFGVSKGVEGANSIGEADKRHKEAVKRYESRKKRLQSRADFVNAEAELFGMLQGQVKEDVLCRIKKLIDAIGKQSSADLYEMLSGASVRHSGVKTDDKYQLEAESVLKGVMLAATTSAAASAATTSAVTMFATASTGAAISGLSGAAANSALLAALGGGSLAAGGGGMALGSMVLGGIATGPAIAIGGIAIASEGEKAITKAVEVEGEVEKAVAQMQLKEHLLDGIHSRLSELSAILRRLMADALHAIKPLEDLVATSAFDKDSVDHMQRLQALLLIAGSLVQVMRASIIDENGEINPELDVIIQKERR